MIHAFFQQTRRNLKIFLKDKANIFFSLLSPLIVLALYVLFLGRVQTDGILAVLGDAVTDEVRSAVESFCDAWMLVGGIACACITVPLCACGISVQDKKRGVTADLLASPVAKWVPSAAYFASVLVSGLIISLAVLAVGFVWLAATGSWYLSVFDAFGCIGSLVLSVFSSSALFSLIIGFIRSEGAFTGLNVISGTVVGFLIGAYMPVSMFPQGVQYFTLFIPGSYSAGLLRNFVMRGALDRISAIVSPEFAESLADQFSFSFDFFGLEIGIGGMAVALAVSVFAAVAVWGVVVFIRRRRKK